MNRTAALRALRDRDTYFLVAVFGFAISAQFVGNRSALEIGISLGLLALFMGIAARLRYRDALVCIAWEEHRRLEAERHQARLALLADGRARLDQLNAEAAARRAARNN